MISLRKQEARSFLLKEPMQEATILVRPGSTYNDLTAERSAVSGALGQCVTYEQRPIKHTQTQPQKCGQKSMLHAMADWPFPKPVAIHALCIRGGPATRGVMLRQAIPPNQPAHRSEVN